MIKNIFSPLRCRAGRAACRGVLSLVTAGLLLLFTGRSWAAGRISIDVKRPGIQVSRKLWGIFFEEINHAGDGGLYAELIKDPCFKWINAHGGLQGWRTTGSEHLVMDAYHKPEFAANPVSGRLDVLTNPLVHHRALINTGYWGMNFIKGQKYQLSFYARKSPGMAAHIIVALQSSIGKIVASQKIAGLTTRWQHFSAVLTASHTAHHGQLAIYPQSTGSLYFNVVSLFPPTWKNQANGLRPDLARMLAQLHPSFVRFPGGDFTEGNTLANRFAWKRTIGPIQDRPGHSDNTWGYPVTDGLGFMEFLNLCQSIHARPLFCFNAGISLGALDAVPMRDIPAHARSIADAVQFANAPTTNRWGALRAKYGHPQPFDLHMLEIGNESWWANLYAPRYRIYRKVLLHAFPHALLIASGSTGPLIPAMRDDHYYNSPNWFWANRKLYNHYHGPNVFVGEYAVTRDCGTGNLRAALAEAAFMTGLERDSNVVKMASYAPLFVNVHAREWNPDMIEFNSWQVCGTPSYWVQYLFSNNRVGRILPRTVAGRPFDRTSSPVGSIGLMTWNTDARFKNIRVISGGKVIYKASKTFAHWKAAAGNWQVQPGGILEQTNVQPGDYTLLGNDKMKHLNAYTIELDAKKVSGDEGFVVLFHTANGKAYGWNFGGWGNTYTAFERFHGANGGAISAHLSRLVKAGRWYRIKIVLRGRLMTAYVNGQRVQRFKIIPPEHLAVESGISAGGKTVILRVVNGGRTPWNAAVHLRGVSAVTGVRAIVLSAKTFAAENTLADPNQVVPQSQKVPAKLPTFTFTFPARSLTILRATLGK